MPLVELFTNVSWISIALFIIGLGLLIFEMFQPGFGLFGVGGILAFVACIFVTADSVAEGIILTVLFATIILILVGIFMVLMSKGKLPNKVILQDSTSKEEGYDGTPDLTGYLGKKGKITTVCRPVGSADFDGTKLEVVTRGEYIDKDADVVIIEIEGNRVVVKQVQ